MNGKENDTSERLGRDSNVVKEETVLADLSNSTEGEVRHVDVEPSEEEWFDSEEDLFYDCQVPDVWFECKQPRPSPQDKWHECKQIPLNKPPCPKLSRKTMIPAYPCVLMLLSFVMLSMHTVGMMLKLFGMRWRERQEHFYDLLHVPSDLFMQLKLYWWPPPHIVKRDNMRRKKLLLTALSIALMKGSSAAPPITLGKDRALLQIIKNASTRNGMLMTAKLSPEGVAKVRDALEALPASYFTPDEHKQVIVDTGATVLATGDMTDFIPDSVEALTEPHPMDGIGGSLNATHKGHVRYEVLTDDQSIAVLEATAYYCPGINCRLFSPQEFFLQKHMEGKRGYSLNVTWDGTVLKLGKKTISLSHDYHTRLPILHCFKDAMKTAESLAMTCITDEHNQNLTNLQKLLLQWHWRLGHLGFQQLQWIASQGWLGQKAESLGHSSVTPPKCSSCQFGKQQRNPKAGSTRKVDHQREGILKAEKLKNGELVFSDQYCSSLPGRVFGRRVASISTQKFCGGTLFYDAASCKIKTVHQVSLSAIETVAAKTTFEREALQVGVKVIDYQTDNGVYTAKEFLNELLECGQGIKHSGVGGHHHNGAAENAIKNTTRKAATMMIHAALRWPDQAEKDLWPLALDHAVYLHNHTPQKALGGRCPEEIWTQSTSSHTALSNARVWGCPAYVLDPRLQDGKKIPKWEPRSRRGQYVGASPLHASTVGIVRNFQTNNLSPQFHVVYDDFFHTVYNREEEIPGDWGDMWRHASDRYEFDEDDPEYLPQLDDEWVDEATLEARRRQRMERRGRPGGQPGTSTTTETQLDQMPDMLPEIQEEMFDNDEVPAAGVNPPTMADPDPLETNTQRRGSRPRYPVDRYIPGTTGMEQAHALLFSLVKKAAKSAVELQDYSLVYAYLTDP